MVLSPLYAILYHGLCHPLILLVTTILGIFLDSLYTTGTFLFCSSHPNIWILVPDYGICFVQLEEMFKLKVLQDSKNSPIPYPVLVNSIEQHVWASICKAISPLLQPPPKLLPSSPKQRGSLPPNSTTIQLETSQWTWDMPYLCVGSKFYNNSVHSLCRAIKKLNLDHDSALKKGLELLKAHRTNYGPEGPSYLVIFWWELPPLYWNALRLGSTMNFMDEPVPGRVPKSELEDPALKAAIKFVDELISLRFLVPTPPSIIVINTFPMFLVIKPH